MNGPSLSVLLVELVGEAEVVQLPRVGREVEGVEVRPLAVPGKSFKLMSSRKYVLDPEIIFVGGLVKFVLAVA